MTFALVELTTDRLGPDRTDALRGLLRATFTRGPGDGFSEQDWQHALGGVHVLVEQAGRPVAHAAVVPRVLHTPDGPVDAGYVEAVATDPDRQGDGLGTMVMTRVGEIIRDGYQLVRLSTGSPGFYRRLGWESWAGPTQVLVDGAARRTAYDDESVMVLQVGRTVGLALDGPLACEPRSGDAW